MFLPHGNQPRGPNNQVRMPVPNMNPGNNMNNSNINAANMNNANINNATMNVVRVMVPQTTQQHHHQQLEVSISNIHISYHISCVKANIDNAKKLFSK